MLQTNPLLNEFTQYCEENPEQRFWQALRNWSGASSVWRFECNNHGCEGDCEDGQDTFYFTTKDGK